ncbi:unnamed protein product [Symbiodinium sp. KB8]|nr:unnamed protein product [Symbiodinium sp. KB8]
MVTRAVRRAATSPTFNKPTTSARGAKGFFLYNKRATTSSTPPRTMVRTCT